MTFARGAGVDRLGLTARAARVPTVSLGPVLALGLVGAISLDDSASAAGALVVAALLLASVAGLVLDDPAAELLSASPTPLARRRVARTVLGLAVLATGWLAVVGLVEWAIGPSGVSVGATSLEAAGLAGTVLALSAASTRITGAPGGTTAGLAFVPLVGVVALVGRLLPAWPLPSFVPGTSPGRWWWVLAGALVVVVVLSVDPGRPSLAHRHHGNPDRTRREYG